MMDEILSIPINPSKPPEMAQLSMVKPISCEGDAVVLKGYLALIGSPFSIGENNNRAIANVNPNALNPLKMIRCRL